MYELAITFWGSVTGFGVLLAAVGGFAEATRYAKRGVSSSSICLPSVDVSSRRLATLVDGVRTAEAS